MCKYYIDSQWDYSNIDLLLLHYISLLSHEEEGLQIISLFLQPP